MHKIKNTNILLNGDLDFVGGKTGFSPDAGYCFASVVVGEDGQEVVVVVLGSDRRSGRFEDTTKLANWVFESYRWPGDDVATTN